MSDLNFFFHHSFLGPYDLIFSFSPGILAGSFSLAVMALTESSLALCVLCGHPGKGQEPGGPNSVLCSIRYCLYRRVLLLVPEMKIQG